MKAHTKGLIDRARQTNAERDAIDRSHGCAPPLETMDLFVILDTVRLALLAGVNNHDWNCVAEGLVILDDFIVSMEAKSILPSKESMNHG